MKCKKLLCLGMAAALAFSGLPGTAVSAQEIQMQEVSPKGADVTDGDYQYSEEGSNELVVVGYTGSETDIVIPNEVNGKKVVGIENMGTNGYPNLGEWTSITLPSGMTHIERGTFDFCSRLREIKVDGGNKVFSSEDGILYKEEKTKVVCCPIGKTQVRIPDGVTSIGEYAFGDCKNLTSIVIPEGVTDIGVNAFYSCSSLTSIKIPESVTVIGSRAFPYCDKLTSIELPSSMTSIGEGAFSNCGSLASIKIPDGVTSLGENFFAGCKSLTSITLPSSVTSFGRFCFNSCDSLKDVYYSGSQEQWKKIEGNDWINKTVTGSYQTITRDVTIRCSDGDIGGTSDQQPGTSDGGTSDQQPGNSDPTQQPQTPQKSDQTITAKNITKTYGAKPFSLNAKANTGTALTYAVSDKKVAAVDKKGKVTIKGCGISNITITAPGTDTYNQATKNIKLTVKPKKVTLSSVKSTKKKTATVKWKQDKKASGYIIQCATDSKFKKNKVQMTVSKNKTVSATVKKLKAGKKYYVRVCAYAKSGKTKVHGDWSKVKTVKIKK